MVNEIEQRSSLIVSQLPLSPDQKEQLYLRAITPKSKIKKHPYFKWDYVEISYVKDCLNDVFGEDGWQFSITQTIKDENQIVVLGILEVRYPNGVMIKEMGFGSSDVKQRKDKSGMLDLGNDYKSAYADCLKKCGSRWIARDVFGRDKDGGNDGYSGDEMPIKKSSNSTDKTTDKIVEHFSGKVETESEAPKTADVSIKTLTKQQAGQLHKSGIDMPTLLGWLGLPPTTEHLTGQEVNWDKFRFCLQQIGQFNKKKEG